MRSTDMEVIRNPKVRSSENIEEREEEEVMAPGFRFHPTDEELVGFYLQRKVQKKPLRIELINQIDIYRYHPWDLPKSSNGDGVEGEREGYYFCRRGRKYRNSKRPNRVTGSGSGFWKATGIDKPIYGGGGSQNGVVIGLKKSLVYYRGSAGKASKTEWMMHEFRLPDPNINISTSSVDDHLLHDAEVWTLCKIFKRTPSQKKYTQAAIKSSLAHSTPESGNLRSDIDGSSCFTFKNPMIIQQNDERKLQIMKNIEEVEHERDHLFLDQLAQASPSIVSYPSFWDPGVMEENIFANGNWDELQPMVQLAMDDPPKSYYDCT